MTKKNTNNLTFNNFLFLWFGAAISIAEILTGALIAPLGFKKGVLVILLGHLIGTVILILGGIIGTRERIPSITSTKLSFGIYGTYLFSILNVLQLVGWTTIMIKAGGSSVNSISKSLWNFDNLVVWNLIIGVLIILWIYFGKEGFKKLNTVAVTLLFILTIVLSTIIFKSDRLLTAQISGNMTFGGALELSVIMPLSWLPLISDYTRFARNEKEGTLGSFLGYFTGSCWMYIIGLGVAIVANNQDIGAMMLAANLGLSALGIVILSTVTTTFLDAYSAGVTFLNIMPKLKEKNVSMIMAVIGTVLAIVFPMEQFENFLYAIGSVFAPLFAILITDYFVIKQRKENNSKLLLNWGAIIVWIFGIILYYRFIKFDFILGATVPVMVITGFVYGVLWRWISKWKLVKN